MAPDLVGKQLAILKEVVPTVSRVALLGNPANTGNAPQLRHAQETARALGMRLQFLEARGPSEIDGAFAAMTRERAGRSSFSWTGCSPITVHESQISR